MKTILIVDDAPSNRQFLLSLLGYTAYCLLEAADGEEALALVQAKRPDLVITDILMPRMDGYELARQVRADPEISNTPIIFYSASYREEEARTLGKAAGVDYVLAKPAEPQAILDLIGTALKDLPAPELTRVETKPLIDPVRVMSSKLAAKMGELGTLNRRLAGVVELGLRMTLERDPERLLQMVCDEAREIIGARYSAVGLLAEDGKTLIHFFTSGMDVETIQKIGSPPVGRGVLGKLLTENRPLRLSDISASPDSVGFPAGHPPMNSFLGVPIATPALVYGRLYLTEKIGTDQFSEEDEQLAVALAAQVAVAYENAQLYDEIQRHAAHLQLEVTERKKAEEQIERQFKQLNALREIDTAINSSFDLGTVLDMVLQQVHDHLGVDASAILLFEPELENIEYAASRGFHSDALHHTRLNLGEGYAGQVMVARKTIHVSNMMDTGSKLASALHLKNESFIDYYGTPLVVKGDVKGILEIYHRSYLTVDNEWLDFLETLAGQAAIAIDNAQLFDNLQRSNVELEQRVVERTAELNRTNAELENANRAKDGFLANMSHELRTPLNSILGLSETLLEERRGSLNDYQEKTLQIIQASGYHLLDLINDILDLSKVEAGMFDIYPEPILLDELCNACLAFVKAQAIKKSITLTCEKHLTVAKIFADPRRLKQILVNLLTNAVKFTAEKGHITLEVSDNLEQDLIHFSVNDDGIGISPENLQRLFQPFVQVDSSLNRQFEGTGLGLALVQKLTDLHGGSVEVKSEVGKGSCFTIHLPCKQNQIPEFERSQTQPEFSPHQQWEPIFPPREDSTPRGVILLAEDKMPNILTVGDYLESHGYEVVVARDGLEAIEKAEAIKPEIILMDIQMPVLDGLEATRRLRRKPDFAAVPIIALTALAMPGDRERCLQAGASDYMSKPVSLKALRQLIETFLHN